MRDFETARGLLDSILTVTHLELYRESQAVAEKVFRDYGTCRSLISQWPSCYSSVQVIVNRATPIHRDPSGRAGWLELLLTLGTYGDTVLLQLRNLGVSVPYSPGSVVLLCCRQILHGVPPVSFGERICYAFYMNKHLFKRAEVPLPGPNILSSSLDDDDEQDQEVSEGTEVTEAGKDDVRSTVGETGGAEVVEDINKLEAEGEDEGDETEDEAEDEDEEEEDDEAGDGENAEATGSDADAEGTDDEDKEGDA